MSSKRDQAQAQSYVRGRLLSALVVADADTDDQPHRRTVTATLTGLVLAVMTVAGFVVYGWSGRVAPPPGRSRER